MAVGNITTDDFSKYGLSGNYARSEGQNLQADINKTERFQDALERAQQKDDPEELMNACKEFETYFINYMYKEMRRTTFRDGNSLIPQSPAEDYFQEMLDEQYSKTASNQGGIGLAKFLYRQLSGEYMAYRPEYK